MNRRRLKGALRTVCWLGLAPVAFAQGLPPQLWNAGEVEAPHSGLTQFPILVAGRALEAGRPEGVQVYRRDAGFCDALVQDVEILAVIKGSGLRVHGVVPVLIIPMIDDVQDGRGDPPPGWSKAEALEFHKSTGQFPDGARLRHPLPFKVGEERVFALFKPRFRDNVEGEWLVWSGADSLRVIPNLHALTLSRPLVGDGSDIAALVRYVQIDEVADLDERIRLLGEHSLAVLRDPEAPEVVAKAAILDLGRQFLNPDWTRAVQHLGDGTVVVATAGMHHTAEYLTDAEMEELVDMALSPKTPLELRWQLVSMFSSVIPAERWRPYQVDATGFLEIIRNRSADFRLRSVCVSLLERVGGESVTATFRAMLSEGNEEDRRLLSMTKEAFRQRERKKRDGQKP